jgi:hypothetical protein
MLPSAEARHTCRRPIHRSAWKEGSRKSIYRGPHKRAPRPDTPGIRGVDCYRRYSPLVTPSGGYPESRITRRYDPGGISRINDATTAALWAQYRRPRGWGAPLVGRLGVLYAILACLTFDLARRPRDDSTLTLTLTTVGELTTWVCRLRRDGRYAAPESDPTGIRTRVFAVRGRCPWPLGSREKAGFAPSGGF